MSKLKPTIFHFLLESLTDGNQDLILRRVVVFVGNDVYWQFGTGEMTQLETFLNGRKFILGTVEIGSKVILLRVWLTLP